MALSDNEHLETLRKICELNEELEEMRSQYHRLQQANKPQDQDESEACRDDKIPNGKNEESCTSPFGSG